MPSPVGLVVKNGWNSLSRISAGMPVAVVADPDLDRVAEVAGRHLEDRLKTGFLITSGALGGGVETVSEQVETDAGDVLGHQFDWGDALAEIALQGDVEASDPGRGHRDRRGSAPPRSSR